MRLSHPLLEEPLHWKEERVPVLVLEHPRIFRRMVWELSTQAAGETGEFVLSYDYEPLDCGDHLHVLRDYVALALDDRKLQNRFQTLLQSLLREELSFETDEFQQGAVRFLETVARHVEYPVSFSGGEYAVSLLKALKFQPVLDGEGPLERVIQYLELYHGLMKRQCFVLVEAHSYFTADELRSLFCMAAYRKCPLLLLEHHRPASLEGEDIRLIDEQMCELHLDTEEDFE